MSKKGSYGIPSRGGKKSNDPNIEYRQSGTCQEGKRKGPSLLGTTASCFGATFAVAGIYKLISDIITFVSPQILRLVFVEIDSIDNKFIPWIFCVRLSSGSHIAECNRLSYWVWYNFGEKDTQLVPMGEVTGASSMYRHDTCTGWWNGPNSKD